MGIPSAGQPPGPGQSTFTEDVFKIELCGPSKQHLTVIDIPGIFRTPTPGITTKEDMALVRKIVYDYIGNPRTIILAVIPAPTDIATQEILTMADEVDPQGQRTLGVLTKPDLVDKGGEENVMDLVRGKKNQLLLGYCIVRNRGQREISSNSSDRHQKEAEFFTTQPWASLDKDRVGIMALKDRLRELLVDLTRREFPKVRSEIDKKLTESQRELISLGPNRETKEQQHRYLLGLATEFQKITDAALAAYYGHYDVFEDKPSLKLATIVAQLNERFSDGVRSNGHTFEFATTEPALETVDVPQEWPPQVKLELTLSDDGQKSKRSKSKKQLGTNKNVPALEDYPEILDVLESATQVATGGKDKLLPWIEDVFWSSRGFELGNFNPAIISTIWKAQSKNWEGLTLRHINRVILVVHRFIRDLLALVSPDERIRANILSLVIDSLCERYGNAVKHVKFCLDVERSGTLLSMDDRFQESLEKARRSRVKSTLQKHAFTIPDGHGEKQVVNLDSILQTPPMTTVEHTVQDIHDILHTYYEVARKRFVDNVCKEGCDWHLITGHNSPLRVFSSEFVSFLTPEQLDYIAGEELSSRRKRQALKQEIEALQRGKRLLAI